MNSISVRSDGKVALFDLLIHSTSALATITVPILTPIAHLSGVSGQVTVSALLLGSMLYERTARQIARALAEAGCENIRGYEKLSSRRTPHGVE